MGKKPDFRDALEELERGALAGAHVHSVTDPHPSDVPEHPSISALRERFGNALLRHEVQAGDEHVVFVEPARIREVLAWLKEDEAQRYAFLLDLTAVDFGGGRPLQVVYQLWSLEHRRLLRLKAELPLDRLEIDSVAPLWDTADWLEREVYDLFGITFDGHPDLRRILMPENYAEGHPLRKDFPLRGRFSRAEQTRRALAMDVEDFYVPSELEVLWRRGQATGQAGRAGVPRPRPGEVATFGGKEAARSSGSGAGGEPDGAAAGEGGSTP